MVEFYGVTAVQSMPHMHIEHDGYSTTAMYRCIHLALCLGWFIAVPTLSSWVCIVGCGKYDGKTNAVASSREVIHALVNNFRFSDAVESVRSLRQRGVLSVCTYIDLCVCVLSSEVVPYLSCVPSWLSCEASWSRAANSMLKRVGTRTQTCLTPFVTGNYSEVSSLSKTVALMPSWN